MIYISRSFRGEMLSNLEDCRIHRAELSLEAVKRIVKLSLKHDELRIADSLCEDLFPQFSYIEYEDVRYDRIVGVIRKIYSTIGLENNSIETEVPWKSACLEKGDAVIEVIPESSGRFSPYDADTITHFSFISYVIM